MDKRERGAADVERDIRGFAIKFYTEDGNWDFWSSLPETLHQVTIRMSDNGSKLHYEPNSFSEWQEQPEYEVGPQSILGQFFSEHEIIIIEGERNV